MAEATLLGAKRDARPPRNKVIFLRVTEEDWTKIRDRAESYYGVTMSDYLRTIAKNEILGLMKTKGELL